jgi:hypothetical protein
LRETSRTFYTSIVCLPLGLREAGIYVCAGVIYLGGLAHWIEDPFTGMTNFTHKSWPENSVALYPLNNKRCLTELESFWQAIQSPTVRAKQYISLAMRWFSKACELSRIDDKLINLMIAAESLSRLSQKEKATPIADTIVQLLLPTNPERPHAKEAMVAAYKLRNALVHEGKVTSEWRKKFGYKFQDESVLVQKIEAYIREALRNRIAHLSNLTLSCS